MGLETTLYYMAKIVLDLTDPFKSIPATRQAQKQKWLILEVTNNYFVK